MLSCFAALYFATQLNDCPLTDYPGLSIFFRTHLKLNLSNYLTTPWFEDDVKLSICTHVMAVGQTVPDDLVESLSCLQIGLPADLEILVDNKQFQGDPGLVCSGQDSSDSLAPYGVLF